jgi:hypothetical protein
VNPQDEIAELENLIDQIISTLHEIVQSEEVLSDEFQGQIAQELGATMQRIDQLRSQISQEPPVPPEKPIEAPIPDNVQLLWILSGSNIDAFVNYLHTYPDPAINALLNNPEQLDNIIHRLHQMMPKGQQPSQNGIPHADINSSNIYGFKYNPKTGKLLVRFQSGSVYGYDNVPSPVFNIFQQGAIPAKTNGQNRFGRWWIGKNPSLGATFYQLIRNGGYPYQRLS